MTNYEARAAALSRVVVVLYGDLDRMTHLGSIVVSHRRMIAHEAY